VQRLDDHASTDPRSQSLADTRDRAGQLERTRVGHLGVAPELAEADSSLTLDGALVATTIDRDRAALGRLDIQVTDGTGVHSPNRSHCHSDAGLEPALLDELESAASGDRLGQEIGIVEPAPNLVARQRELFAAFNLCHRPSLRVPR
jgi:hypothetical protein